MENLILIHGALGSARSWQHIVPHLQGYYHIHAIDLPGHGTSVLKMDDHSIKYFSNYILEYTKKNSLNNYIVAGYSMGGYIGLYMAANQYKGFQKLYTIATKMRWDESIAAKEASKLDYHMLSEKAPQFLALQQNLHPNNWPIILSDTQAILKHIGQDPITSQHLSQIEIPVCMCVGSADQMVTQEETSEATNHISNSSSMILNEQPHILEKMDGGLLANSIKEFVG